MDTGQWFYPPSAPLPHSLSASTVVRLCGPLAGRDRKRALHTNQRVVATAEFRSQIHNSRLPHAQPYKQYTGKGERRKHAFHAGQETVCFFFQSCVVEKIQYELPVFFPTENGHQWGNVENIGNLLDCSRSQPSGRTTLRNGLHESSCDCARETRKVIRNIS